MLIGIPQSPFAYGFKQARKMKGVAIHTFRKDGLFMEKEECKSEEGDRWGTDFKIMEEDRIPASYQHFIPTKDECFQQ